MIIYRKPLSLLFVSFLSISLVSSAYAANADQTTNISIGAKGETACATDTGSCSLNQLLQRIAQRLTTTISTLSTVTVTNLPATVDTNSGNKSASTPRVVEATDAPANALKGQGATAAAPPSGAVQAGVVGSGAAGGLLTSPKVCDLHAIYDGSDNGSITLVTGVASRKIYVCGYVLATGGTATNLKLTEGSNANCASNSANLTPAYQLAANAQIGALSTFWSGLAVSTNGYYICVNASAGNAHQAEIWYTIQ